MDKIIIEERRQPWDDRMIEVWVMFNEAKPTERKGRLAMLHDIKEYNRLEENPKAQQEFLRRFFQGAERMP